MPSAKIWRRCRGETGTSPLLQPSFGLCGDFRANMMPAVESLLTDEVRLCWALLINAAVFWAAWRFVRRGAQVDAWWAGLDAFGLYYAIQYLSVGGLGLIGALAPWTMSVAALGIAAALWIAARRAFPRADQQPKCFAASEHLLDRVLTPAGLYFVIGYAGTLIWYQRVLPVMSNDAMAYHLPAAVQWLRTGRLGLFPAWFYNPANAYSPLTGSMFMAWLIAPMGNDVLARFVQAPALIFVFLGMVQLGRAVGVRTGLAALIAVAAVTSRPFMRQVILAKDDLFLAGFFLWFIAGCAPDRLKERLGPWRAGIALGLFLACKYTALLSLPLLVLVIDAPWRAGWRGRQWLIVGSCVLLLAAPWYVRNAWLAGNPLYPTDVQFMGLTLFSGQLTAERSLLLRCVRGAWGALVGRDGYYTLDPALAVVLLVGWIGALLVGGRELLRRPLLRLCVLGPVMGVALFVLKSPYGEIRFVYPSVALLFACLGLAVSVRVLPVVLQVVFAMACAAQAARTVFAMNPPSPGDPDRRLVGGPRGREPWLAAPSQARLGAALPVGRGSGSGGVGNVHLRLLARVPG